MRRLLLTLIGLATAAVVSAQVFPITLPSHVIVDSCSGCGGAAPLADNAAFTFGTTGVTPIGAVVDDTATNTVSENSAGAPRMNTNRILYMNPRNNAGTEIGTTATPIRVSGTVTTGTGVSGAESGLIIMAATGAGTTWGPLQVPVDVQGTITANAGTNLNTSALALDATVTGRLPAGASPADNESNTNTNLSRVGTFPFVFDGATWDRWTGAVSQAGTWTVTTTPPSNASTNVAQFGGTNVVTGTGAGGAGIPRVTISNDSSLAPNQSVNVAQVNGATTTANNGTAAAGSQRIVVANDNSAIANWGQGANNGTMPAAAVAQGVQTVAIDTSPTAATAGNLRYQLASTEGVTYVQEGGPKRFSCTLSAIGSTRTQCQAAPAAGLRAYVTSISVANNNTTAGTFTLSFGTGTNCATGTTTLMNGAATLSNAAAGSWYVAAFPTPLIPTAANAICIVSSAAQSLNVTLTGYTAP